MMKPPAKRLNWLSWPALFSLTTLVAASGATASTQPAGALNLASSDPAIGFQSQLWEHFYRSASDDTKHHDEEALPDHLDRRKNSSDRARQAQDHLMSAHPAQVASQIVPDVLGYEEDQLDVEESRAPAAISDWTIAKLTASHGETYTPSSSNGPSPTIILVGIVAAIVLMGAMFAGKE